MGQMYVAPRPECPVHGAMSHVQPPPAADWPSGPLVWPPGRWVCHGWDGEGCGHTVTDGWVCDFYDHSLGMTWAQIRRSKQ